jgi:hypothetical protein
VVSLLHAGDLHGRRLDRRRREPPKLKFVDRPRRRQDDAPALRGLRRDRCPAASRRGWLRLIKGLQERGIKVLYEVDDYLHGIERMKDHDFRQRHFGAKQLSRRSRRTCAPATAVICSTPYIAMKYRRFAKQVFLCENGVDTARYRLTRPERPSVNIGWAGGTGHVKAAVPWISEAYVALGERDNTCFVSIGQNFADTFKAATGVAP